MEMETPIRQFRAPPRRKPHASHRLHYERSKWDDKEVTKLRNLLLLRPRWLRTPSLIFDQDNAHRWELSNCIEGESRPLRLPSPTRVVH